MALMNSNGMINLNRMAYLMSISEITPQLYLSGQIAATAEQVQKLGITYIVNVAVESSPVVYPKPIKLEKFDIIDFPTAPISNYFNIITDKIHSHLSSSKQNKVLVHCMAGISRSVTIVCAYLVRYLNMPLRDAYLLCKKNRPICFPNLGFWNQLITYEYQLRKENSVKMIPTQFGHVPDVAFEEIKQSRNQPLQPQPASLPFFAPTFASTISNPTINSPTTNDTLFVSSSQARQTARDISINPNGGTTRSRSLATNAVNRPSIAPTANNPANTIYQPPGVVPSNKPTFSTPTRYGIGRLNPAVSVTTVNNAALPGNSSQNSFASSRSLPAGSSPNAKQRTNPYQPTVSVTTSMSNPAAPPPPAASLAHDGRPSPHYETTYRSSFIRPLIP